MQSAYWVTDRQEDYQTWLDSSKLKKQEASGWKDLELFILIWLKTFHPTGSLDSSLCPQHSSNGSSIMSDIEEIGTIPGNKDLDFTG